MLKTMDGESHLMFQDVDTKGRKQAITFKGFCRFHDKITFQPIEDFEFKKSAEQLFLYTYRTLAWDFHKKLEQVKHLILNMESLKNKGFHFSDDLILNNSMHLLGYFENESTLKRFNEYLQNENYEKISSYVWTIPYEIKFAVSTMLTIEHDIKGNMINNVESFQPLNNIYLNIFPSNQESYLICTWESNHEILARFAKQFESLEDKDKKNYLIINFLGGQMLLLFLQKCGINGEVVFKKV